MAALHIYLYICYSVFTPCRNFLWTLWAFWGERATSDISSWAHLINKWINYARFMGWCTSKHFKGHGECPWGAIMRGSSARRQIWWPRFSWTWSFSHFVCTCSFRASCSPPVLFPLLPLTLFPPRSLFFLSWSLISRQIFAPRDHFYFCWVVISESLSLVCMPAAVYLGSFSFLI